MLADLYIPRVMQIEIFMVQQFLFQKQWQRVRSHAQKLGISIMGDMPIYVGYHSADVWANRKSFLLVYLTWFPSIRTSSVKT
jgi:4-alpha-glucanotransferase